MSGPLEGPLFDPRIRARRSEVRRDATRRRRRRLVAGAAGGGVVAGGGGLTQTPLLYVGPRPAGGGVEVPEATVAAVAGVDRGSPLVAVDPTDAAGRLEQLPWVAEAEVRRRWPGTVEITLRERQAVAQVAYPDRGWALVAGDGVVVEERDTRTAEVPVVEGVAPGADPGEAVVDEAGVAVRVAAALPEALAERVAEVELSAGAEVRLVLESGAVVRVGDAADELGPKLTALVALADEVDLGAVEVIDVRVPTAPVLTRDR